MFVLLCCTQNQNRSMAMHELFLRNNYLAVKSFGTSKQVKLPGDKPGITNTYSWDVGYDKIYEDLQSRNREFYEEKGILRMLERNMKIKKNPERIFDWAIRSTKKEERNVDVVIASDYNNLKMIYDEYGGIQAEENSTILIGFNIKDTLDEAEIAAKKVYEFIIQLNEKIKEGNTIKEGIELVLKTNQLESIIVLPIGISLKNE